MSENGTALRAEALVKSYGGLKVVDGVSLELRYGEVLGLLGPNGAGKTTTVGMLYGAVRRDEGLVSVGGFAVPQQEREAKRILGVVTQEDRLDEDFTVLENLRQFAHRHGIGRKAADVRALALLEELGIRRYAGSAPSELSGGLKRRLVLARALMHEPRLLFLDEPTTGLDPDARQDFWMRIASLKEQGYAMLLTTHYMDEAERLCDRLLLIQNGRIIDEGTPHEIILKHAGEDAIEAGGISEEQLAAIMPAGAVRRPLFDGGVCVSLPGGSMKNTWQAFHELDLPSLRRRKCNLEDVFLLMTGRGLE